MQWVVLKMLPFDNKSEFQVVVDMPEGTPVEQTRACSTSWRPRSTRCRKSRDYQVYAGTAAPINFNGLVRQYYLRTGPSSATSRSTWSTSTSATARATRSRSRLRPALAAIGRKYGASVKVVEVPPGPPVQAPLVAEIYGPIYGEQQQLTREVRKVFDATPRHRRRRRQPRGAAPRAWSCAWTGRRPRCSA